MKPKIIIVVILVVASLSLLIVQGLKKTAVYYYTISELRGANAVNFQRGLRVSGTVAPRSILWDAQNIHLSFILVEGSDSLRVSYHGTMPDQLADAQQIVVEGVLEASGIFHAEKILMKCPSKYEVKKK